VFNITNLFDIAKAQFRFARGGYNLTQGFGSGTIDGCHLGPQRQRRPRKSPRESLR
jgi:hypothetical protein